MGAPIRRTTARIAPRPQSRYTPLATVSTPRLAAPIRAQRGRGEDRKRPPSRETLLYYTDPSAVGAPLLESG
eukprot:9789755-Alexandrium_andersonii.AAC.1